MNVKTELIESGAVKCPEWGCEIPFQVHKTTIEPNPHVATNNAQEEERQAFEDAFCTLVAAALEGERNKKRPTPEQRQEIHDAARAARARVGKMTREQKAKLEKSARRKMRKK